MQQLQSRLQQLLASSPEADKLRALLQSAWLLGPKGMGPNLLLSSCPGSTQARAASALSLHEADALH